MEKIEDIPVYIRMDNHGKTICICYYGKKKCSRNGCYIDCVSRDRFRGWEETMNDKYGK